MTAHDIIHGLEHIGYTLTVVEGNVRGDWQDMLPPPPESAVLLEQLRQRKGEVLDILRYRGFETVPPSEGDLYVITVDATNERDMLRWAVAVDTGLIALEGKILYRTGPSTALIRYRCSFPPEWLPDAITRAAKVKYALLPDPDADMFQEDVRREVRAAIDRLPVDQALVVRGYYLEGTQQNTIAAQMGVSSERARQIKRKGWNGLRKDRRLRGLADDVMGAACYWHKGLAAYHRDWTSTVERAVIGLESIQERLRREAVRRGISEETMREWGL